MANKPRTKPDVNLWPMWLLWIAAGCLLLHPMLR